MLQDLPGQSLGHYRIIRSIEQGGMASVFLAHDFHLQRDVAVKVFQPQQNQEHNHDFFRRFTREAQTVAHLDHPNILLVYDYGEQDKMAYLVMPYLALGSLKQKLKERFSLPVSEALPLIAQLLEALQYAHDQGLIHRDIKPGNILFKNEHVPLLADFGLVKKMATADAGEVTVIGSLNRERQPSLLTSGLMMGTPYYMAPEQIRGQVQPASDIYSIGVVLYEMLTGQHPLTRERTIDTMEMLLKQLNEPPRPIRTLNPAIPPQLSDAIMRALEKDPTKRYQHSLDFLQVLRASEASWNLAPLPVSTRQSVYEPPTSDENMTVAIPEEMLESDANISVTTLEQLSITESSVRHSTSKKTRRGMVRTLIAGSAVAGIAGVAGLGQLVFQRYYGHSVLPTASQVTPVQATSVQTTVALSSGTVPSTKRAILIYRGHIYDIKVVAWSSFSGGALIASTDGSSVQVWRSQDGVRLFKSDDQTGDLANANLTLEGASNGNNDLAWSPVDPNQLAFFVSSQDNQHTPYLWKQDFTSAEIGSASSMGPAIQLNLNAPYAFAWSPDGYYIAVGSDQGVTILPNGKGAAVWHFQQRNVLINALAWSPDSKYLAFTTDTTQIWDVTGLDHTTNTKIAGVLLSKQAGASSLAWSPNGTTLAMGTQSGSVGLWDVTQRKIIRILGKTSSAVNTIAWSPNGKYITWTNDGIRTLGVWNTSTGEQVFLYEGHAQGIPTEGWRIGVKSVAWSPNGRYIASGDNGGTVQIWTAPQ